MAISNNDKTISTVKPHTIKKFELIEKYIETWAQKVLQNDWCEGIVFIDCMCNSGVYTTPDGKTVYGTPIRVSRILRAAAGQYPHKKVCVYLNDNSAAKIELLRQHLPKPSANFQYSITELDANERLKQIGPKLSTKKQYHFFLLYDPYEAAIDWTALAPFFQHWGEVLINHMVSDSVRAVKQAKRQETIKKYEETYLSDFDNLVPNGDNRETYERRIEQIIAALKGSPNRRYYVAAFPVFNTRNALVYDLVHCTSNVAGFRLYKSTAWKTFGDKSSTKNTHGSENLIFFDLEGSGSLKTNTDERCFYVKDIVDYLQSHFAGQTDVPFDELWHLLDEHPIFPSDGYRKSIKAELKTRYGAKIGRSTISFLDRR